MPCSLCIDQSTNVSLSAQNLLLQVTQLQFTQFAYSPLIYPIGRYGAVVYTGNETKFGQNKNAPKQKIPISDYMTSVFTVVIVCLQVPRFPDFSLDPADVRADAHRSLAEPKPRAVVHGVLGGQSPAGAGAPLPPPQRRHGALQPQSHARAHQDPLHRLHPPRPPPQRNARLRALQLHGAQRGARLRAVRPHRQDRHADEKQADFEGAPRSGRRVKPRSPLAPSISIRPYTEQDYLIPAVPTSPAVSSDPFSGDHAVSVPAVFLARMDGGKSRAACCSATPAP